jgi:mono/diheme cytochrome c family protein
MALQMDRQAGRHRVGAFALVVVLGAAGLGLGGCGGGGSPSTPASVGETVFHDQGCGSCHTLSAAGTSGTAGPPLDGLRLTPAQVREIVAGGAKGMPAYRDRLGKADLNSVARFVARSSQ